MKLTKEALKKIIKEELDNIGEIEVGDAEIDPSAGELPDHVDIVNDLINAMSAAGKKWLSMASRGQTPETIEKLEIIFNKMENYLLRAGYDRQAFQSKGAYDVMKEDKKSPSKRK